jgi:hypothetical protein
MAGLSLTDPVGPPIGVPHLAYPFEVARQGNRIGARTVEQDSQAEIAQCVYAVLATPPGSRIEAPDFGLADPTFLGADLDVIRAALDDAEPRAVYLADEDLEGMVQTVTLTLT